MEISKRKDALKYAILSVYANAPNINVLTFHAYDCYMLLMLYLVLISAVFTMICDAKAI